MRNGSSLPFYTSIVITAVLCFLFPSLVHLSVFLGQWDGRMEGGRDGKSVVVVVIRLINKYKYIKSLKEHTSHNTKTLKKCKNWRQEIIHLVIHLCLHFVLHHLTFSFPSTGFPSSTARSSRPLQPPSTQGLPFESSHITGSSKDSSNPMNDVPY